MEENEVIKRIFKALTKFKTIDAYFLHQQYALYPGEILMALETMQRNDWVLVSGEGIEITREGRKELIVHRSRYFFNPDTKAWKEIPKHMLPTLDNNRRLAFDKNYLKKPGG